MFVDISPLNCFNVSLSGIDMQVIEVEVLVPSVVRVGSVALIRNTWGVNVIVFQLFNLIELVELPVVLLRC